MQRKARSTGGALLREMISLAELEKVTDTSRRTLRRSLNAAGIQAVVIGSGEGRNVTIRYYRDEINDWLRTRLEPVCN